MTRRFRLLLFFVAVIPAAAPAVRARDSQKSFETVVHIPVAATVKMKDHQWRAASWANISSQVHIDKVYIETYCRRVLADAQVIEEAKKFFLDQGVKVAGAICYSDSDNGQFVSFTYTKPADRDYVKHVSEFTAQHCDEVILDPFFSPTPRLPPISPPRAIRAGPTSA